jgi:hypothetical protein
MQRAQGVHGLADGHPVGVTISRPAVVLCVLAVLVAIGIATAAFRFGDQPLMADASEYLTLGRVLASRGPLAYGSELRTYGYPAFLAGIVLVVGQDTDEVRRAVFVVQLALTIVTCWVAARRLERVLGIDGIRHPIFLVTVLNPFLLLQTVQVLTDLPAALVMYLAAVLSLPSRTPESQRRVCLLAAAALCCTGIAVMLRPSSLAIAPVVVGIWLVRVVVARNASWYALALGLLAFAVPFLPQMWSNARHYEVASPLIVRSLYRDQLVWGLQYAKYGTLVIPGLPNTLFYVNPFRPTGDVNEIGRVIIAEPGAYLATLAVHAFGMLDQDYPLTYIRDVDPWYRWPLSVLNYLFFLGALVGVLVSVRRAVGACSEAERRQHVVVVALSVTALAVVAIYLPTAVESRFSLPLYLLFAAPCVLAARRAPELVATGHPLTLSLGVLLVVAWVGGAAAASVWLQSQAPMLKQARTGVAVSPETAQVSAPQPGATAGPTAPPEREVPVVEYVAALPREAPARRFVEFDVTVTNKGREAWNRSGAYPVNVAVRFVAQNTELYQRVKGLMMDSQPTDLPADIEPGASATVHVRVLTPPEPGRYTMMVHVTRIGVPDSPTKIERTVRVTD